MRLSLRGKGNFHRAAADLRKASGQARYEFQKGLKDAAEPTLRKVRRAAATMRIVGFRTGRPDVFHARLRGGHIRAKLPPLVDLQVVTNGDDPAARFVVHSERLRREDRNMPYLLDSGKIFRHPIPPNNRHRWAGTRGQSWFYEPIKEGPFNYSVGKAADRVIRIAEGR